MNKNIVDLEILTANHNNGIFLEKYFDSIFQSTYWPKAIIFIDDKSSDHSLKIVHRYKDKGIELKIISLKENIGFPEALNTGIGYLDSSYFMRLDPDDFIHPKKIELQYIYLTKNNDISLVGTNAYYYLDPLKKIVYQTNLPCTEDLIKKYIYKGKIPILHSSIMGKTEIFQSIRYDANSYPAEDYDLISKLIKCNYRISNLNKPLLYYRIHDQNLSSKLLLLQVKKTALYQKYHFNIHSNKAKRVIRFLHLYYYRKAISTQHIIRYLYFFLSSIFDFSSVKYRIINFMMKHLQ